MKIANILLAIVSFFLVSCQASTPDSSDIQTAVAQTQAALPKITYTTIPTDIPIGIPTASSIPTEQATTSPDLSELNSCLPANAKVEQGKVVKITDGDTIEVDINSKVFIVRYIGINSSEVNQPLFQEAKDRNSTLVYQKEVVLVRDVSETDQYNRLLRYVFIDGEFVNETLVKKGLAIAKDYPPDSSCKMVLSNVQAEAKTQGIGVWLPVPTLISKTTAIPIIRTTTTRPIVNTPVVLPTIGNVGGCPQGCLAEKPGCSIKGNISSGGEKIYHVPGSSSYSATKIDPTKGERWFCTQAEAVANGWRAPKN